MKKIVTAVVASLVLASGYAMADTRKADGSPPPAASQTTTAPAAKNMKSHTAAMQSEKSKKCSADADAKQLHGKERKKFRHECMKSA